MRTNTEAIKSILAVVSTVLLILSSLLLIKSFPRGNKPPQVHSSDILFVTEVYPFPSSPSYFFIIPLYRRYRLSNDNSGHLVQGDDGILPPCDSCHNFGEFLCKEIMICPVFGQVFLLSRPIQQILLRMWHTQRFFRF